MQQRIARTVQLLARFITQGTARDNAAEASAALRQRRQDQEDVDDYLLGRAPERSDG